MKKYDKYGILLFAILFFSYNLFGQNPNWTLPPQNFKPTFFGVNPLPQPSGSYGYTGAPASNMHAAYSDPHGDVLVFTVDENVYDKNGYLVDVMRRDHNVKKGFNERLILPFGNDCSRFAILYIASATSNEDYVSKLSGRRLYLAEYDLAAPSTYPNAIGALKTFNGNAHTLEDISKRDADLYGVPGGSSQNIYNFQSNGQFYRCNIQIAATELIDNCYYYVFVSDGRYIMRYKLSDQGFEWDNYVYEMNGGDQDLDSRTEMELLKLSNGNYRIAVYKGTLSGTSNGILVADISGINGEVITNSEKFIPLNNSAQSADPYGIELSPTGRYVYFTHVSTPSLPNKLDVYDLQTSSFVSLPPLSGIGDFQKSYIERYNDKLYVVTSNRIGQLSNINAPNSLALNSSFINIIGGYGNSLSPVDYPSSFHFRYILPDQVDMPYSNLAEMSCDCCKRWHSDIDKYTASGTETWSPGAANNPFGSLNGVVYVRDELRIPAGANITISDMKFYFGPNATVYVEAANSGKPPGYLKLTDQSVFSADWYCSENPIISCGAQDGCDKTYWQGVRVEGDAGDPYQSSHKQGNFEMEKGSMIEYAEIGILVGSDAIPNLGGGIISVTDSKLKDNGTGIKFKPYTRHNGGTELYNKSGIYRNTFETTNDWYSSGHPNAFIDIDNSSGIYIKGNEFENSNTNANFALTSRGIGIIMRDARVTASWACAATPVGCVVPVQNPIRNEFKSLTYGIYGLSSGIFRTLTCNYGLFQNNQYGIFISNLEQPKILDNTFEVPMKGKHVGLYMTACTGYDVQNNDFSTYGPVTNYKNIGILVSSSGAGYNEIYRNTFRNMVVGGQTQGVNTDMSNDSSGYADGLNWLCNVFNQPMYEADIVLTGSMADEQGECKSPSPARNLFSHSSTIIFGHKGLKSYPSALYPIDYNHNPNTSTYPRLIPLSYSGQTGTPQYYQLQACNAPDFDPETSCPVRLSGAPETEVIGPGMLAQESGPMSYSYLSDQVAAYAAQITALENQLGGAAAETEGTDQAEAELAQLRQEYRELWHRAVGQYQNDTLGTISTEQLQSLLIEYQPQPAARFASILLPQANTAWISQSNLSSVEAFSGGALPTAIGDSLPYQIPAWFESDFFATASNASALNARYIENEAIYEPYIVQLAGFAADWGGYQPGSPGAGGNPSQLSVQPNPFTENVQFNLSQYTIEGEGNRIVFFDIAGKQLFTEQIGENRAQIAFAGNRFPEGIILYTLYVNNVPVENGKMIRVK